MKWIADLNDSTLKNELEEWYISKYMETIIFYIQNNKLNQEEKIYQLALQKNRFFMKLLKINFYLFAFFWRSNRKMRYILKK